MKTRIARAAALLAALLFLFSAAAFPASAASDGRIPSIRIHAVLNREGDAAITEEWTVDVPEDWSEVYTVKSNLDDRQIKNFQVQDASGGRAYQRVPGEWDVDRSRAEKAGKYGSRVNEDGDLELCWGAGSPGRHTYRISYTMTHAVRAYSDGYDGFNIRFVNEGMSAEPDFVQVTVSALDKNGQKLRLTKDNASVWVFGLDGKSAFEDGNMTVRSTGTVHYCNILARFQSGLFAPAARERKSFASVQKKAMRGSSYEPDSSDSSWWGILTVFGIFGLIWSLSLKARQRRDTSFLNLGGLHKDDWKNAPYSREIPFDGNLAESWLVLRAMENTTADGALLRAYLLRWLQSGSARLEQRETGRSWNLFGDKKQAVIRLAVPPESASASERAFWNLLEKAAGGDGILQEKELYHWSKEHYTEMEALYRNAEEEGREAGESAGDIGRVLHRVLLTRQEIPGLTEQGRKRAVALIGFRSYLKDFTLLNEREATDVGLWGDYLVFASLFGIADQVARQFRDLLPSYFEQPPEGDPASAGAWDYYSLFLYLDCIDRMAAAGVSGSSDGANTAARAAASAGEGGFTSLGGGGGFSGGGFGGGGR